jgi:hypothetical protein
VKRVTFIGAGDLELTVEADFSDAGPGEIGQVRVQAEGIDVDTTEGKVAPAKVYGWFTPDEAREIARYLTEMADRAEVIQ